MKTRAMAELPSDRVRRICDPALFDFKSTLELQPLGGLVGQDRAIRSLEFALDIGHPGFNVFVSGPAGTGKAHAVESFLRARAQSHATPSDWCYVNNFQDPYRPKSLQLPAGRGKLLQAGMEAVVRKARHEIPKAFESEEYAARHRELEEAARARHTEISEGLNQKAASLGFDIRLSDVGYAVVPVQDGTPLGEKEFLTLPPSVQQSIQRNRADLDKEVQGFLKAMREIQRGAEDQVQKLNREVADYIVGGLFEELREHVNGPTEALDWLKSAEEDIISNAYQFLATPSAPLPEQARVEAPPDIHRYRVNVVVDNSLVQGAPVVIENNPTYLNLLGGVEQEAVQGALRTDHTLIKAGALHRANGGYLVLSVEELFNRQGSYEGLKHALRNGCLQTGESPSGIYLNSSKRLQPDPIPLQVKVILLGSPAHYHSLHRQDEQFREIFKVKADFDNRMDRTSNNVQSYAQFVSAQCQKEGLLPLDAHAVAKLVELGSRLAEDQEKLTTQFGDLADVLREANHWALGTQAPVVSAAHVKQAVDSKAYRSNLIEERLREFVTRGAIRVETAGALVGQVNGLAITSLADYVFGSPLRITATVGVGRSGVIDVQREAQMSGAIHTKGVLILGGYMEGRYGQDKPLSLSARIVIEQNYDGIDGDSASTAELYALLSALSEVPINQEIGVTGSVDQFGRVQAIGGVNQKIEGFFDVCRIKGLTGGQGVMIPKANVGNLMLREDVADAVARNAFHVWAVETVDEGIEILTGKPAGKRCKDGTFPKSSVHQRVNQRLLEMAKGLNMFGDEVPREQQRRRTTVPVLASTTRRSRTPKAR